MCTYPARSKATAARSPDAPNVKVFFLATRVPRRRASAVVHLFSVTTIRSRPTRRGARRRPRASRASPSPSLFLFPRRAYSPFLRLRTSASLRERGDPPVCIAGTADFSAASACSASASAARTIQRRDASAKLKPEPASGETFEDAAATPPEEAPSPRSSSPSPRTSDAAASSAFISHAATSAANDSGEDARPSLRLSFPAGTEADPSPPSAPRRDRPPRPVRNRRAR